MTDENLKTFTFKHEKSDGVLNVDGEHVWGMVGEKTVFDIKRDDIRFCTRANKGTLVINREHDGVMKTMSIRSKHAGAILDALL